MTTFLTQPAHRTRRIRRAAPVLLAAALLAAATGCEGGAGAAARHAASGTPEPGASSQAPAALPVPGDVAPGLQSFYTQKMSWKPCEDDEETEKDEAEFSCAKLRVPLDYADPGKKTIELAVMRHAAGKKAQRIGSLVTNPGGPGGSGLEMLKYAYEEFDGPVHDRFDVIGVDPRGVGESSPVRCLDDRTRDARDAEDDPDDPAAALARGKQLDQEFAAACQAKSGELLPHIGTRDAARDMDVLRQVLGDTKLNYLGVSYGTYLGTLYAEQFPQRVGRMVLDAAVDPAADDLQATVDQMAGFEGSFERFAADCAKKADCPLGTDPAQAAKKGAEFLDGLEKQSLPTQDGRRLTSSLGWTGTLSLLYGDDTSWKMLREAFTYAMTKGDGSALLFYADNYNGRKEDGTYDNSEDALTAIHCADGAAPAPSAAQTQDVLNQLQQRAPLLTKGVTAEELAGPACEFWPYKTPEKPHTVRAEGAAPILVVGTTGDPATPYAAAEKLAAGFASARLLTLEGEGHGAFGSGNSCINDALAAYLVDGKLPNEGTRCK